MNAKEKFEQIVTIADFVKALNIAIEQLEQEMDLQLGAAIDMMAVLDPDIKDDVNKLATKMQPFVTNAVTDQEERKDHADEVRVELSEAIHTTTTKREYVAPVLTVEGVIDETETDVADEVIDETPEVPEGKVINLDGYDKDILVAKDGNIYVDGELIEPYLNRTGYAYVALPATRKVRVLQHKLVALAYLPKSAIKNDGIRHLNDNPVDCRPENLAWISMTGQVKPRIDASDVIDICIALIHAYFDVRKALMYLLRDKKKISRANIEKVLNKEVFVEISDKYFDEYHRIRRIPQSLVDKVDESKFRFIGDAEEVKSTATTATTTATEVDPNASIRKVINDFDGDILKAYEVLKKNFDALSIYRVFNVKNNGRGTPPSEDVDILIRVARNSGSDIRQKLLDECDILVNERDIARATRKQRV